MNLDALLQPGSVPWSPNGDVTGLEVWNAYDHPLTGTFVSGGQTVLFTMVSDFEGHMSLWAYTYLSEVEAKQLAQQEFATVPELRTFIESVFQGRRVVFALAGEGRIVRWAPSDETGSLPELAISFLNDVLITGWRSHGAETELRVKLAQVATGQAELVGA